MEQNERLMKVIDSNGNEKDMYILFVTKLEQFNKQYVFYVDPKDESGEVFVSSFDDNHKLLNVDNEEEWVELEKVFDSYVLEMKNHQCSHSCSGNCSDCGDECECDGNCDCDCQKEN